MSFYHRHRHSCTIINRKKHSCTLWSNDNEAERVIKATPRETWLRWIRELPERYDKCVKRNGDYFEQFHDWWHDSSLFANWNDSTGRSLFLFSFPVSCYFTFGKIVKLVHCISKEKYQQLFCEWTWVLKFMSQLELMCTNVCIKFQPNRPNGLEIVRGV